MRSIQGLFDHLSNHYGYFDWWQNEAPFEVMAGAILVQNTAWTNVEKALHQLGADLTPERIFAISEEELAQKIRPSGYYNQKAKKLKAFVHWYRQYHFSIAAVREKNTETLRKELLEIKGVGPETADAILVYAIKRPSFVIDAYTRRIFSRYGLAVPYSYSAFQEQVESTFPKDTALYAYYHGLMVEHAQRFCSKTPRCYECPIAAHCQQVL